MLITCVNKTQHRHEAHTVTHTHTATRATCKCLALAWSKSQPQVSQFDYTLVSRHPQTCNQRLRLLMRHVLHAAAGHSLHLLQFAVHYSTPRHPPPTTPPSPPLPCSDAKLKSAPPLARQVVASCEHKSTSRYPLAVSMLTSCSKTLRHTHTGTHLPYTHTHTLAHTLSHTCSIYKYQMAPASVHCIALVWGHRPCCMFRTSCKYEVCLWTVGRPRPQASIYRPRPAHRNFYCA